MNNTFLNKTISSTPVPPFLYRELYEEVLKETNDYALACEAVEKRMLQDTQEMREEDNGDTI
jgi:hypothetical protein